MKLQSLFAAAGFASVLLGAPAASAQMTFETAPWIRLTTSGGCTFFVYDYDDPGGTWYKERSWKWTGGCTNGVASGTGDLTATAGYENSKETYETGFRGAMVNGFLNGRIEELHNGKMLSQYHWQGFEMGCGTAASFVSCKPYTGSKPPTQQAAPPPATVPPNAPTPQVLAQADWEVIRKDLDISPDDRIFAVAKELATTGKLDLVRQANIILARRYPNSPLLPVVMDIIGALDRGDPWPPKDQAQAASTPAAAPAATATTASVTPANGPLDIEAVRRLAEVQFGPAKDVTGTSTTKVYEITIVQGGFNVPISLEVSASGNFVWLTANVGPGNVTPERAALALKRIGKIQPTMIWDTGAKLRFGTTIENRGLTTAMIKAAMERVANDVANNTDIWQ